MATIQTGTPGPDLLTGTAAADELLGLAGDDRLEGLAGDDLLDGGMGNDTLLGGLGDDGYVVNKLTDVVTERAGEGRDTVTSSVSWTLDAHVEALRLVGGAALSGIGNGLANLVVGSAADNLLQGLGGDDQLEGRDGDDRLDGGSGNDLLLGGAGNDLLDGGMGDDVMRGGAGDDSYVVSRPGDRAEELAGEGYDTVSSALSWTLGDHLEALRLTGGAALAGTGNALANLLAGNAADNLLLGLAGADRLEGGAGDDRLDGGMGNDLMLGGLGDDAYSVNKVEDRVQEAAGEGYDTVTSVVSWALSSNIEELRLIGGAALDGTGNGLANLLVGSAAGNLLQGMNGADRLEGRDGDDRLDGGSGDDLLLGGAGNDWLDGGMGNDVLQGGLGDDTYRVSLAGDQVVETAGAGYDTVEAQLSWTLGEHVEALRLQGRATAGTGNALDNLLAGNALDNVLHGMAGDDLLLGGDGADVLHSGTGNDRLEGGAGNDLYVVEAGSGAATILDTGGDDVVQAWRSVSGMAGIERLELLGDADIDGAARVVSGNAGANRLQGFILAGGAGDDTYVPTYEVFYSKFENRDRKGDLITHNLLPQIIEQDGEGTDTLIWRHGTLYDGSGYDDLPYVAVQWTLPEHVENLILLQEQEGLSGNALDNHITASDGRDIVAGGAGADTMLGGDGDDTLSGDAGDDRLEGGEGDDQLSGGAGDDRLLGGVGNDWLDGGTMLGGTGDDTYRYSAGDQAIVELDGEGYDRVLAEIDIDLRQIAAAVEYVMLLGDHAVGTGTDAADHMVIQAEGSSLYGLGGDDLLESFTGGALHGGSGNDRYLLRFFDTSIVETADGGHDTVEYQFATGIVTLPDNIEDALFYGSGITALHGNAGDNLLRPDSDYAVALWGGDGRDRIVGGAVLQGEAGDDILEAGRFTTRLDGGAGDDLLQGGTRGDAGLSLVFVVDSAGDQVLGSRAGDVVASATAVDLAGLAATTLRLLAAGSGLGNAEANLLEGSAGADSLDGGAGDDRLQGGGEGDRLTGGVGADVFRYDAAAAGGDVITDFISGVDRIEVSAVGFGGGLQPGMALDWAGRFSANATGESAEGIGRGQFILNTTDNSLWWDVDGPGGVGGVRLAQFESLAQGFTAADIVVA